jgi:hypothetical protein
VRCGVYGAAVVSFHRGMGTMRIIREYYLLQTLSQIIAKVCLHAKSAFHSSLGGVLVQNQPSVE